MSQPTPEQLQALLQFASKRLGVSPEQLEQSFKSGDFAGKVDAKTAQKIAALSNNPQAAEQLLQSPKAQEILKKLLGGK